VDEFQRSLRASLEAGPGAAAREEFFRNLPKNPDALSFWLSIAVRVSQQSPWWYDTLAAYLQPGPGNEGCPLGEACARVADAACIDESVVRKIWRRSQPGQE